MGSKFVFALFLVLSIGSVNAADIKVGRYSTVKPKATPQQQDPLSVVIDIKFTKDIQTVGDALEHILLRSGFYLATGKVADPHMPVLINSTLPEVHRHIGPITLRNALKTLSGEPWVLVEDPVNRLVSFELKDEYRGNAQ